MANEINMAFLRIQWRMWKFAVLNQNLLMQWYRYFVVFLREYDVKVISSVING